MKLLITCTNGFYFAHLSDRILCKLSIDQLCFFQLFFLTVLNSFAHISTNTALVDQPLRLLTLSQRLHQIALHASQCKPSPTKAWNGSGDIQGQDSAWGVMKGGFRGIWGAVCFITICYWGRGDYGARLPVFSMVECGCLASQAESGQKGKAQ